MRNHALPFFRCWNTAAPDLSPSFEDATTQTLLYRFAEKERLIIGF